jgi:hypothetical protein
MNKEEPDIDPNIFRQNAIFLENQENYKKYYKIDNNESITPTTDMGYLTPESKKTFFQQVSKKLEQLKNESNNPDFYKNVKGNFQNKNSFDDFLRYQEETVDTFLSDKVFIKKYQYKDNTTSKVLRFGIDTKHKDLKEELDNYNYWLQEELKKSDAISNISNETNYKKFSPKCIKIKAIPAASSGVF